MDPNYSISIIFALITVLPPFSQHRMFFLLLYIFFNYFSLTYHIQSYFSYTIKIFPEYILVQWLVVFTSLFHSLVDDLQRAYTFIKLIHTHCKWIEIQIASRFV